MSFYNPDAHTLKATSFASRQFGNLAISEWTKVEMTSALGIQVRRGDISVTRAEQVLTTFNRNLTGKFYLHISTTDTHFLEAERLLRTFNRKLRGADALHLALAKLEHLDLATLDNDLLSAAQSEAVNIAVL